LRRIRNFLTTTLIGGLVVILPIAIFIFFVNFLIGFVNNLLQPIAGIISRIFDDWSGIVAQIISFVVVVLFCFMVGIFIRTRIGNNIFSYIEKQWLLKLPLYGTIKETIKQFFGNEKTPFTKVVLVDIFNNGTRMTGFVTDELPNGKLTIFVPTGPNPTNGFIFHVDEEQVEYLDTNTEDAMRSIIGVGVGSADALNIKA